MSTGLRAIFRHPLLGVWALVLGMSLCPWGSAALAAGPIYWDMPAGLDFANCSLDGVRITSDGFLAPGLARGQGVAIAADVVWTTVPDGKGGYFLGTGHDGKILRLNAAGEISIWVDLDCEEVLSLLVLSSGGVVAGCEPDGQVFLIDGDAQAHKIGEVPGGYVWSMVPDDAGLVYLATGTPAGVTVLDPVRESLHEVFTFPAENALDVIFAANGDLLVATQGPGLVYRLDPANPKTMDVILQTAQDEVIGFIPGPDGNLCVLALDSIVQDERDHSGPQTPKGQSASRLPVVMTPGLNDPGTTGTPRSALYNLEIEGGPRQIWSGDLDLMSAAYVKSWGWVGGGLQDKENPFSVLYRMVLPAGHEMLTSWQGGNVIALEAGTGQENLRVVQTNPSRMDFFGDASDGERKGTGPVLDAGRKVNWGRLHWTAEDSQGALRLSVRTGNREPVDDTWSGWSGWWRDGNHQLQVPSSRFLQWRVDFSRSSKGTPCWLTGVTVSAWGENRAPIITKFKRENLRSVRKGGLMVQRANLTRIFDSGLKAEFNRSEVKRRPQPAERVKLGNSVVVFSWDASDPDQDRLGYQLDCRKKGDSTWVTVAEGDDGGMEAWDTSAVPDGTYDVRLTLDDKLDNPGQDNRRSERVIGPVTVDNTPPEIEDLQADVEENVLHLKFKAMDVGSPLAAAFLVWPDGSRERLDPRDMICDSMREVFSGDHALTDHDIFPAWAQVEVLDTAGNMTTAKISIEGQ